jgi:DNA mismatch endonuclease (patch repair protein)
MSMVRSTGTTPELIVAAALDRLGVAYRQHATDLPGTPDFVIDDPSGAGLVLFVHGCWWHGHTCPRGSRIPKRNRDYWTAKVARNRRRDRRVSRQLRALGYAVWTVWECELKRAGGELPTRMRTRLGSEYAATRRRHPTVRA